MSLFVFQSFMIDKSVSSVMGVILRNKHLDRVFAVYDGDYLLCYIGLGNSDGCVIFRQKIGGGR